MIKPGSMTIIINQEGKSRVCKKDRERITLWRTDNFIFHIMVFNIVALLAWGAGKLLFNFGHLIGGLI